MMLIFHNLVTDRSPNSISSCINPLEMMTPELAMLYMETVIIYMGGQLPLEGNWMLPWLLANAS